MSDSDLYGVRPRQRRAAGPLLALLIATFLLGLVAAGVAVRRSERLAAWLHPLPPPPPVVVTRTVPVPAPSPPIAASNNALAGRVDALEAKIATINARAAEASGDADRAERLLIAFAARRALDRGQPLGFLEGMLRERFGAQDAPAVALIIATGQKPVLLAQLQDGLDRIGPTLAAASPHEGWWTGVRRQLAGLFVVRHADRPSTAPADRLERAAHALDQGQVDAAAAEVARMPGAVQAGDWLAAARRYVLARGALDRIETDALLTPPKSPPSLADG